MAFWNRKEKQEPTPTTTTPIEITCPHVWKDFDWYLVSSFENGIMEIGVVEPYVCVLCGERKDKTLAHRKCSGNYEKYQKEIAKYEEVYKGRLKPAAFVEDAIWDTILVDREKLKILEGMREL